MPGFETGIIRDTHLWQNCIIPVIEKQLSNTELTSEGRFQIKSQLLKVQINLRQKRYFISAVPISFLLFHVIYKVTDAFTSAVLIMNYNNIGFLAWSCKLLNV